MKIFKYVIFLYLIPICAAVADQSCDPTSPKYNVMAKCQNQRVLDTKGKMSQLTQQINSQLTRKETKERFNAAQKDWKKFADSDCHYQYGPSSEGGRFWIIMYNECINAHAKQRIELLEKFSNCTENGCPY